MTETQEAPQETSEPVAAPTEAPAVETAEAAPAPTEDTSAPEPEKSGVQKRIDQLTWQAREAERRALAAEQQLQSRPTQEPQQGGKPTLEQFDDYDSYVEALAGYKAQESIQAMQAQQSQAQRQAEEVHRSQSFRQKADTFSAEHPDFNQVVFDNPYLPITGEMKQVIETSDKGPEVAYHLGQNPQLAAQIAQMHPIMQAAELGKIEAGLSFPKTKTTTSAPAPIEPIGGGEAGMRDTSKMSMEEYAIHYKQNLRR